MDNFALKTFLVETHFFIKITATFKLIVQFVQSPSSSLEDEKLVNCPNSWGPWELDTVYLGMNYVPGAMKTLYPAK